MWWKGNGQGLPAGEGQKKVADALVTSLAPIFRTYLNNQEELEKKRQFFHLDHLSDKLWEITGTQIRKHATRTYRDNLDLTELKAALDFLGDATTIDEAISAINNKQLTILNELNAKIDPIINALKAKAE